MTDPALLKNIKIKTGVLKRCLKEYSCYIEEAEKLQQKIVKLKADAQNDEDEYRAKKEEEVLQESRSMIGNTARRASAALVELKKTLEEANLGECQELNDANEQINAAASICCA